MEGHSSVNRHPWGQGSTGEGSRWPFFGLDKSAVIDIARPILSDRQLARELNTPAQEANFDAVRNHEGGNVGVVHRKKTVPGELHGRSIVDEDRAANIDADMNEYGTIHDERERAIFGSSKRRRRANSIIRLAIAMNPVVYGTSTGLGKQRVCRNTHQRKHGEKQPQSHRKALHKDSLLLSSKHQMKQISFVSGNRPRTGGELCVHSREWYLEGRLKWGGNSIAERSRRSIMGLLEDAEKIAGAVIAVEGVKKLDPNASILTEGAAAVAGFEGAGAIAEHFEKKEDGSEQQS